MKAFILAAGLGTRLKPWTEHHPKALVPVGGVPMLQRVILKLKDEGFDRIVINIHHFADQIIEFIANTDLGVTVTFSDESETLLDTGGGLLKTADVLGGDNEPFLVHNVDILSDAPLGEIMRLHSSSGRDVSLVTSPRDSSRKLIFDTEGNLRGWHNIGSGEYRPEGFAVSAEMNERAFSGIYVVSPVVFKSLKEYSDSTGLEKFPIMDFFMHTAAMADDNPRKVSIGEIPLDSLSLIDIGKPETLKKAEELF